MTDQQLINQGSQDTNMQQQAGGVINLLHKESFDQLYRVGKVIASSTITPQAFQGSEANCMIAYEMSKIFEMPVLQVMQSMFVVHGKVGWEAKFVIARLNQNPKVDGVIKYEFSGKGDDYGCTASIKLKNGDIVSGPKVTWSIVKKEGWDKNPKWKTMHDLMFRYRAASWLARTSFPESLLGMLTKEEIEDVEVAATPAPNPAPRHASKTKILAAKLEGSEPDQESDVVDVEVEVSKGAKEPAKAGAAYLMALEVATTAEQVRAVWKEHVSDKKGELHDEDYTRLTELRDDHLHRVSVER